LLVRVGRDYELTPLARLLLPQVQATLPLIEKALASEAPFDPATSYRTYTLMMSDFAQLELKSVFEKALEAAPGIRIDLLPLPANPTDSERELLKHDFIAAVPGIGIDGESVELFTDYYVCLVDQNNPALVDGELTWDAFRALPQAVCDFGQAHFTPSDRRLRELGFAREARVKTTSFMPLPSAIAGTDLVAVVPSRLAAKLGPVTGTMGVPTPFGRVEIIETLWWHAAHNSDPSHVWMREMLTSEATGPTFHGAIA
jgi:DNA-binding transcriptional LysR family regulator